MKTIIREYYANEITTGEGMLLRSTGNYEESENGSIPICEWSDSQDGETYRYLILEAPFSMRRRTFSIIVEKHIQTKGGSWKFHSTYERPADDRHFTNISTGESELQPYEDDLTAPLYEENGESDPILLGYEQKLKATSITDAQFFINLVGKGLYGSVIPLYPIFIKAVKRYEGLI